jgi:hypothetical protein
MVLVAAILLSVRHQSVVLVEQLAEHWLLLLVKRFTWLLVVLEQTTPPVHVVWQAAITVVAQVVQAVAVHPLFKLAVLCYH